jgi:guanylate kinase
MNNTFRLPDQLHQLSEPATHLDLSIHPFISHIAEAIRTDDHLNFLVLAGPSGVGKSHMFSYLQRNLVANLKWILLRRTTSRIQRTSDLKDEFSFVTENEFVNMEKNDDLIYSEFYTGNSSEYGLSIKEVERALNAFVPDTILVITGTLALCQVFPNAGLIYLVPPSLTELRYRVAASNKPNATSLLTYDKMEIIDIIKAGQDSSFIERYPISIICNETKREEECAKKIAQVVMRQKQIIDIPDKLLEELRILP